MLVKCKGCGNKVERNEAFKVVIKNKNHYYCSAVEYAEINAEKEARSQVIDYAIEIIGETTNTSLFKELTDISKVHGYQKMASYIESNLDMLHKTMTMEFNSEYGKIRYFTAILKNELGDYVVTKSQDEEVVNVDVIETVVYTPTKKKSMLDYIDEY